MACEYLYIYQIIHLFNVVVQLSNRRLQIVAENSIYLEKKRGRRNLLEKCTMQNFTGRADRLFGFLKVTFLCH